MCQSKKLSKKEFDLIIKQNLIDCGIPVESFGFKIGQRIYEEYYSEDEFEKFVDEMRNNYFNHYKKFNGDKNVKENTGGKGGELAKKSSRYGLIPPKMASVASSSRFCYIALRDGTEVLLPDRVLTTNDVEFEKECKIFDNSSTSPQLDAYISDDICDIYVEVKCHEIFDSHKPMFKAKYWPLFKENPSFCAVANKRDIDEECFQLPLNIFDITKESTRFDIKQFICHLFGIAKQNNGKKSKLVYLFFKPTSNDAQTSKQIDEVFYELISEIKLIFGCKIISDFCKNNNIELMAIAQQSQIMDKLTDNNTIYFWK